MTRDNRRRANPRREEVRRQAPPPPYYCWTVAPRLLALMTGAMGGSEAFEHFRNAGIEVLKGFRAVLDAQIEALGRRQSERGTKIPVE